MNDSDWETWRAQWTQGEGKLPDVRAIAERQQRRHRLGTVALIVVLAGGVAGNLWAVFFDHGDAPFSFFLIAWAIAVSAAVIWLQRGARVRPTDGPRQALAYIERRLSIELKGAQLVRWAYAIPIVIVSVYYRDLFGDDRVVIAVARTIMAVMFVASVSSPWWVKRLTARQRSELDGWRRWMEEQQL